MMQFIFFPNEKLFWSTIVGAVLVTITAFDLSLNLDDRIMKWYDQRKENKSLSQDESNENKEQKSKNVNLAASESAC